MTDIATYCDVNTCEDCPRYGDDCDGDKRVEHTDLISRADAIEIVLTYFIPRSHTGERGEHEEDFVRTIFKALPSADAVHGEWIKRGTKITCSHCKSAWSASFDTIIVGMKYCPYCGAKMGGDDE